MSATPTTNQKHQGLIVSAQSLTNTRRNVTNARPTNREKRSSNSGPSIDPRTINGLTGLNGLTNLSGTINSTMNSLPLSNQTVTLSNNSISQLSSVLNSGIGYSSNSFSGTSNGLGALTSSNLSSMNSQDKYGFTSRAPQSAHSILNQVSNQNSTNRPQSAVTAAQKRIYEYSAKKFQRFDQNTESDTRLNDNRPQTEPGKGRHENDTRPTVSTIEGGFIDQLETSSTDSHSTANERPLTANGRLTFNETNTNNIQNDERGSNSSLSSHSNQVNNTPPITVRDDEVIIHVYDETNKVNKDFVCKRDLLLKEMKYFSAYLTENSSFDDIDISVHCDVNIFQWLMDYIKNPGKPPKLDTSWAVSILISSDFLEMGKLVQTTLRFVHDRLQQIIKLPIDLDCINSKLMTKLAKLFTCDELDQIRDKRDKIISRLYQKKLEQFLSEEGYTLAFCQHCKKVYFSDFRSWMICPKAKMYVDVHGKMIAKHSIDPNWNINKFIVALRKAMLSWKQIYWQIWGLVHCFYCTRCNSLFPSNELDWCAYHPKEAAFEADTNVGRYACCKSKTMCFDSGAVLPPKGCTPRNHVVITTKDTSDAKSLDTLMRKTKQISTPHGSSLPSGENEETFELLSGEEPTTFEGFNDNTDEASDEKLQVKFHKCEIYYSYSRKYRVDGAPINPPLKLERKKKKGDAAKMSATRTRFFLLDKQRERDAGLMKNITNMLHKCRKQAKNQPDKKKKKRTKRNKSIGPSITSKKIIRV